MITPAVLSVSDDSPRITGDAHLNNQITVTISTPDRGEQFFQFQVGRKDLEKLLAPEYRERCYPTSIPAKVVS